MEAGESSGVPPETAEEIRAATRRAFAEHGYANLSMAKIAAESEYSQSLLHYHFDTKAGLVSFFIRSERRGFERFLESLPTNPATRFEIVRSAVIDLEYLREHDLAAAYVELYGHAAQSEPIREALCAFDDTLYVSLRESLVDAAEAGVLDVENPERAARALFAFHESALVRAAVGCDVSDLDASLGEFVIDELRADDRVEGG